MIQTQKKIFRILTGIDLFLMLVFLGSTLLNLATGGADEANQFFDNRLLALTFVVWAFVFYKMYTFKKIGRNLFVPMLIIGEFITWYLWEPYDIDEQAYWVELIIGLDYFISGLLIALMYLTNMKKEFQ